MEKIIGIYRIQNITNDRFYIGSSKNMMVRWRQHLCHLKCNTHGNPKLQADYNKCGLEAFSFTIVLQAAENEIVDIETSMLKDFKNDDKCYNLRFEAWHGGINNTKTANKNRSIAAKKRFEKARANAEEWQKVIDATVVAKKQRVLKTWIVYNDKNEKVVIHNVSEFCRQNGYSDSNMYQFLNKKVYNGKFRKTYKGFTHEPKE